MLAVSLFPAPAASTPLLAICIPLVVLLVAVIAIAIAAILLAMYLARESVKMQCLTCKAYCRKEKQPSLPLSHRTFNLLSDGNGVEVGMPGGSRWGVCGCVLCHYVV